MAKATQTKGLGSIIWLAKRASCSDESAGEIPARSFLLLRKVDYENTKELSMWDFWILEEIAIRVLAGIAGCVIGVLATLFFQWVF